MTGLALDHAAWSSPWRTRSVRDKGVLAGGLLLAAITLAPVPGALGVAVVSLVLLLGPIQVGWGRLGRIGWLPLLSILIGVATVAVSLSWDDGLRVQLTEPGLAQAGQLAIRAIAATLAMFVLACSTPVIDLLASLRRARVPAALIEIAALSYRFTFGLLESVSTIQQAQQARLGYANRRAAMRSASMSVASIFLRSWERAQRLEGGLAGRGYQDELLTLEPPRQRSARFLLASLGGVLLLAAASFAWQVTR